MYNNTKNKDLVLIPIRDLTKKAPDTNKIRAWNRQYNDSDSNSWSDLVNGKAPMTLEHALEHDPNGLYAVYPKGSGCVVIDVDVLKEGDSEKQKKIKSTRAFTIEEATGAFDELFNIKPFAVYKTTSGGIHLYYNCAPKVYDMLEKQRGMFRLRYKAGHIMAGDILMGNYAAVHIPIVEFAKSFRDNTLEFNESCAEFLLNHIKELEVRKKGTIENRGKGKRIRNVEATISDCLYTLGDNPAYVSERNTWNTIVYCACVAGSEYVNGDWQLNDDVRRSIEQWNKGCPEKVKEGEVDRIWAENKNFDVSYRNGCLNRLRKEAGIKPEGSRSGSLEITNELVDEAINLVKDHFRHVCVNPDTNCWRWYKYDSENTIWRRDDKKDGASVRKFIQAESDNEALRDNIMLPPGRSVLRCIEDCPDMESQLYEFNPNPHLLNMPGLNLYDTETDLFMPGTPEMLLTRSTSVAVNEEYLAQYLEQTGAGKGDNMQQLVWKYMMPANKDVQECIERCKALHLLEGHMLCGHSTRAFQLQLGGGANGKSTYNRILELVLGDYAGSVGQGAVVSGKNMLLNPNSIGDALIPLQGKMRSVIPEVKGTVSSMLKLLTGEDSVSASAKYLSVQTVKITSSFVMTANVLPELTEVEPYRDRVYVIPFEQKFGDNPNLNHAKEFCSEENMKQALRWLIIGHRKQKELGGQPKKPESWKIRTEEYLSGSDTAGGFVEEMIELDQDSVLTYGEIREAAECYYVDAGKLDKMRKLSNGEFSKVQARMRSDYAGKEEVKFTKRNVKGIRFVDALHDAGGKASAAFDDVRKNLDTIQEAVQKVDPDPQSFEKLIGVEPEAERAAQEAEGVDAGLLEAWAASI